ncbi:MAG: peptidoglycan-binding domain-containing protein [Marinobacter sp.]|uniref:peptidoglycan-binding domain-containing protein n=1 Tax=Marinobacter sp. TaxID=50741 RepID=UPI003297CB1B
MLEEENGIDREVSKGEEAENAGPDPRWKKWIIILLCLEIAYIVLEFGFNAALLNVASGLFSDPESLDNVELAGRVLSGVGFGFLIYGVFVMKFKRRPCEPQREFGILCLIMPIAIGVMYVSQELLIEKAIVDKSSDEERFAATYLQMVKPAIRNGTLILEDVPITQETSDRPENKAFLAISGMLMASNDKIVDRIPREIESIVGAMVHRRALESQGDFYSAYQQVDSNIQEVYERYRDGMVSMSADVEKALAETKKTDFYRSMNTQLQEAYYHYASGAKAVYEAIGSKMYFKPYYVASACNPRKTTYKDRTCRASYEKNGGWYKENTGTDLDVLKFCDLRKMGHQQCDWSAERVGRLVYSDLTPEKRRTSPIPLTVKGIPLGLNKRQFYQHKQFANNFGTKRHNGIELTAKDLVLDGSGVPRTEASVRKALTRNFKEELVSQVNRALDTDAIRYGMSKNQFMRVDGVQSAYRTVLGDEGAGISVGYGLSDSEFLETALLPMSWNAVAEELKGIPKSVSEMQQDEVMMAQGKNAVRAMVVPPIALVLSLFFSLFTMSKVFHHFAVIGYIKRPKAFPLGRVKLGITSVFLVVVASFPFFLPENPMVKTGIVQAAVGNVEGEKAPNKLVTMAMDWMIRAEPIIYPIANQAIGLPKAPFNQFHDPNAQSMGSHHVKQIDTLNVISSLPVSDVQRRLNGLGYNAGPVDGLMGGKTMEALRSFQKDVGLAVTGAIDAETSMALIKR